MEQGTPGAVGGGDGRGVEGGDGGSKEQSEISYDYEELKSRPEVVNMPPDTFLELQYPTFLLCSSCRYICRAA